METRTKTKLDRIGEEWGVVLPAEIVERLGLDEQTPLEAATDGSILLVAPVGTEERRRKFAEAVREAEEKYGRMFQRLADS